MRIFALTLSSILCLAADAQAASTNATAQAVVADSLFVTEATPLSFGAFTSGPTAGRIGFTGVASGGVNIVSPGNRGTMQVSGTPNAPLSYSLPLTVTLQSGANSLIAEVGVSAGTSWFLRADGTQEVTIIGALDVAANQPAGHYTGSYEFRVDY